MSKAGLKHSTEMQYNERAEHDVMTVFRERERHGWSSGFEYVMQGSSDSSQNAGDIRLED